VTHNEAVDHIRREARLSQLHSRSAEERQDDCAEEPSSPLSRADRMTLVLEHLGKLRPYEQQVVLLRLEEGLSYREISQVTGRTEGNVGNILFHAVRQLSASLRKAGAV
jgi:RNA polymerase sigma-70 factor (ECF subfamily)